MQHQIWPRDPSLLAGEEYHLNNKIAEMTAQDGYELPELLVPYEIGAFGRRKMACVLVNAANPATS